MSAQDKIEQILRDFHILFSQGEMYDTATNRVIVDKRAALTLLQQLNVSMYELLEEHEMTAQSRAASEREVRRRTDEIVQDANRMAEDVYAASVIYTDEALCHVQDIMQETADAMKQIYERMNDELLKEKAAVRHNQLELKSHLEDLHDTNKYEKLIEERNKELLKKRTKDKEEAVEPSPYVGMKPEIKINAEYFEKAGISLTEEEPEEIPEEKSEPVSAEVRVNLDAEYFKWKEDAGEQNLETKKSERTSLLDKILKSEK